MIAELSALLSSSKVAYDIAKGVSALKSDVDRNESISKILEILLSVQTQALSVNKIAQELQEEKHELTRRVMEFERWFETEQQYELKEIATGIFVYSYKVADNPSKPMHWLCPKCYQEKKAHIIQFESESAGGTHYLCPNCNMKIKIKHKTSSSPSPDYGHGGPKSWMGA